MLKTYSRKTFSNSGIAVYLVRRWKIFANELMSDLSQMRKKLTKLTSKPTFVSSKIFNDNLVAVHKIKETLTLNRPAYVGMYILDFSKTLMCEFNYNYIKKNYGDKSKLLFTDTDSLNYEIKTDDVYRLSEGKTHV